MTAFSKEEAREVTEHKNRGDILYGKPLKKLICFSGEKELQMLTHKTS